MFASSSRDNMLSLLSRSDKQNGRINHFGSKGVIKFVFYVHTLIGNHKLNRVICNILKNKLTCFVSIA
jgi:hypothetical protein